MKMIAKLLATILLATVVALFAFLTTAMVVTVITEASQHGLNGASSDAASGMLVMVFGLPASFIAFWATIWSFRRWFGSDPQVR